MAKKILGCPVHTSASLTDGRTLWIVFDDNTGAGVRDTISYGAIVSATRELPRIKVWGRLHLLGTDSEEILRDAAEDLGVEIGIPKPQYLELWTWFDDRWHGLRLKAGEEFTLQCGGPCEEGYSRTAEVFTAAEDLSEVTLSCYSNSRDCDGTHSSESHRVCKAENLSAATNYYGESIPKWEEVRSSQRDYSAEAMGY